MSDSSSEEDLAQLVTDLVHALRDLESEIEPPDEQPRLGPPTPSELRRFASEVAIPGLILVLETNIRALRLLQRTLRLTSAGETASQETEALRNRAKSASAKSLDRLDDALGELQTAIEGRPENEEAVALLAEARDLRDEIQNRLEEATTSAAKPESTDADTDGIDTGTEEVAVNVDAELASIKDELDAQPQNGLADDTDDESGGDSESDGGDEQRQGDSDTGADDSTPRTDE